MKEIILFDLDGTLTNPSEGIVNAVNYGLNKMNIQEPDLQKLLSFIGPPLFDSFKDNYLMTTEEANQTVTYFREYYGPKGLLENQPYDGIKELLEKLREKHYHLVVATSKPEEFAVRILEHFELAQYFDLICGASFDESRVRKGDVIAYALHSLNIDVCDKPKIVMVGDRLHDIEGAKQNGIDSIGVLYGFGNLEELELYRANWIVGSVEELYQLINNI